MLLLFLLFSCKHRSADGTPAEPAPRPALWGDVSLAGQALIGPSGSQAGGSVAGVGDINGDGRDEVLIGADELGVAYLLSGTQSPGTLAPVATLTGPTGAGRSVAGVGDVDGDGYADVLIGGGSAAGNAWLAHGPLTGTVALLDGWTGSSGDSSGLTVAGPGDLTGDGHGDLLVAAPRSSRGAGTLWLLPADAEPGAFSEAATATLTGAAPQDFAGYAMDGAGDVDGDGHRDLIVGAWGAAGFTGEAAIILGPITADASLADADLRLAGITAWDLAGFSVSGAGDVTGDGRDDVIVGAYGVDGTDYSMGAAYVIAGGLSRGRTLNAATARLMGEAGGDNTGWSVAGAGDVNGDGIPDLLVGATGLDVGVGEGGGGWLFYGPVTGSLSVRDAGVRILGEHPNSGTGHALDGAGDTDGDGMADVLIGAPGAASAYLITQP